MFLAFAFQKIMKCIFSSLMGVLFFCFQRCGTHWQPTNAWRRWRDTVELCWPCVHTSTSSFGKWQSSINGSQNKRSVRSEWKRWTVSDQSAVATFPTPVISHVFSRAWNIELHVFHALPRLQISPRLSRAFWPLPDVYLVSAQLEKTAVRNVTERLEEAQGFHIFPRLSSVARCLFLNRTLIGSFLFLPQWLALCLIFGSI